ncbi:BQ2448_5083 [Microbotryum intermedium]|uniref:BQ2448_5083 protein n=1 Tax=Microbotryum intermedium TaxID=269621 RepID=A0A238F018_9BASI|nr:BQ2448_5083 [Microbotryum intermedium]
MSHPTAATTTTTTAQPSPEEISELLLCSRYGDEEDLQEMQAFVAKYGSGWLAKAKDERGNTCLHLSGANGHDRIISYLLPLLPPSFLTAPNEALSTPLHWISLNYHLTTLQLLCPHLPRSAYDLKNLKGKTAVQEAEEACEAFWIEEKDQDTPRGRERVRREKVVGYLLERMGLGVGKKGTEGTEGEGEGEEGEGGEVLKAGSVDKAGEGEEGTMERLTKEAERIELEQKEKGMQA